ncbi:MAG: SusD/RagB family nutrient-binding outer membrane lipoprotein [Bacteroidales bacterium]
MKRKIIIIIGFFSAFLLFNSCTESYIEGYEISPNDPVEVLESNLLSAAEVAVFGNVTGELARLASIFVQSQAGVSNQSLNEQATYQIFEGDNVNDWGSIYGDWMETAQNLIDQAGDENPYYKGMGLVLKAWAGAFASDTWGDVPFSEALQGIDNLNPVFDSQQSIYAAVQTMLSDGITNLSAAESANKSLPGSDDFIFKGNVSKWIKMAWVLKARYANRVSKKSTTSADDVLTYLTNAGLTGIEDNAYAKFGANANNANQWYAFYQTRTGYMSMGEYFINKLVANNDPRLPFYSSNKDFRDTIVGYVGSPVDTRNFNLNASEIGPLFNGSIKPVPMVTYEEAKFLEAEAYLRKNNPEAAASAYNLGVLASVLAVTGADAPAAFVTSHASKTVADINLETIMLGKYDALFTQIEVWTDWRRTGLPTLVANPDPMANSGGIPYRLPASIDERTANANYKGVLNMYQKPYFAED